MWALMNEKVPLILVVKIDMLHKIYTVDILIMTKNYVKKDFFEDKRELALTVSCDGYQIFQQKTDNNWVFLVINNNLAPEVRVKKENLIICFIIPGPNQPKDFYKHLLKK